MDEREALQIQGGAGGYNYNYMAYGDTQQQPGQTEQASPSEGQEEVSQPINFSTMRQANTSMYAMHF